LQKYAGLHFWPTLYIGQYVDEKRHMTAPDEYNPLPFAQ